MNDPSRKGGRPPLIPGQRTTTVHIRLPETLHDDACRLALRHGLSVGEVVREALARHVSVRVTATRFVTTNTSAT